MYAATYVYQRMTSLHTLYTWWPYVNLVQSLQGNYNLVKEFLIDQHASTDCTCCDCYKSVPWQKKNNVQRFATGSFSKVVWINNPATNSYRFISQRCEVMYGRLEVATMPHKQSPDTHGCTPPCSQNDHYRFIITLCNYWSVYCLPSLRRCYG